MGNNFYCPFYFVKKRPLLFILFQRSEICFLLILMVAKDNNFDHLVWFFTLFPLFLCVSRQANGFITRICSLFIANLLIFRSVS